MTPAGVSQDVSGYCHISPVENSWTLVCLLYLVGCLLTLSDLYLIGSAYWSFRLKSSQGRGGFLFLFSLMPNVF